MNSARADRARRAAPHGREKSGMLDCRAEQKLKPVSLRQIT